MKKTLFLLPFFLAACGGGGGSDDAPDARDVAVIATRTPDFSSGAVSLVDVAPPNAAQNGLDATISDIGVRSGGDHFFLLEKFMSDRISRYEASTPTTATWTYSTQDAGDTVSSNPYDLIVASPTKAYLLRYGSSKLWIVNPSATTEAAFKTGEIDLAYYDTADGIPEMSAGIIRDGKLFLALQRLVGFNTVKRSYIAVFDVATDTEITTGNPDAALKGIRLPVRNPDRLEATPDGDLIVIATGGFDDDTFEPVYNGGIARIDTTTYATTLIQDDGTPADHPYGQFTDVAIAADDRGYFVGSTGFFGSQTLYRFDPRSATTPVAVTGFTGGQIGAIAVDPEGQLWVTDADDTDPGVAILGFAGGAETVVKDHVSTTLIPINIDFATVEGL